MCAMQVAHIFCLINFYILEEIAAISGYVHFSKEFVRPIYKILETFSYNQQ